MTPLKAKYIRDLTVRGRAQRTQRAYTRYVSEFARYYKRSPELISYEEVTDWLYHLITERQLSASSVNVAVNAVRFLYGITLGRNTEGLTTSVPHMKQAVRRPEIYARSELEAILTAPNQPRDRAFLMTVYSCGLRVAEARDLKTSDIDRARMQLRVRNGKGGKGRVLPLSNRLLKELVDYWRAQRQGKTGHDSPWLTKPSRSARLPARTSITAQSKRAVCAAKAAFIHYAIVLQPISSKAAWNYRWCSG
jgi:site-specific recombinase XerD